MKGINAWENFKFNLTKIIASYKREVKEREKKRRGQQRGEKNVRRLQSPGDTGHLPPAPIRSSVGLEMTTFYPQLFMWTIFASVSLCGLLGLFLISGVNFMSVAMLETF